MTPLGLIRKSPPLLPDGIYILDISILDRPLLLNNKFEKWESAIRAIKLELEGKFSVYKIIRGKLAIKHGLLFKKEYMHGLRDRSHVRDYKFDYPKEILGNQKLMVRFRNNVFNKAKYHRLKNQKQNNHEHNNI